MKLVNDNYAEAKNLEKIIHFIKTLWDWWNDNEEDIYVWYDNGNNNNDSNIYYYSRCFAC